VRDLLLAEGRTPDGIVAGGVINRGTTLQRREDLAWSYGGRRLSLTLQAFASASSTLDPAAGATSEGEVRQRGLNTSASYRLTPTATATLSGSRLLTLGNETHGPTSLKSLTGTWSSQFNRFATASLSARYSSFASPTEPYREAAVTASLSLRY
jgi:uncharacterized protein (PEP-CTERM system associated)